MSNCTLPSRLFDYGMKTLSFFFSKCIITLFVCCIDAQKENEALDETRKLNIIGGRAYTSYVILRIRYRLFMRFNE